MRRAGVIILSAALMAAGPSLAAPRIASMNVCTDQLLLSLADTSQIAGLSPYARDDWQSWQADKARQFPLLSGGAEDILVLKPDVAVASQFDKRTTRELLRRHGVRLVEFAMPRTLAEVKAQIRQMAGITGHAERADAEIARLDAAMARAREALGARDERVLALSRRGWVDGRDSLIGALLQEAGLRNAADELGLAEGGFVSLEAIIALKPDLLVVAEEGDRAEDEGTALLLHPALERFYPPSKRMVIPERLIVCGGVMLADALDLLVKQMKGVRR